MERNIKRNKAQGATMLLGNDEFYFPKDIIKREMFNSIKQKIPIEQGGAD